MGKTIPGQTKHVRVNALAFCKLLVGLKMEGGASYLDLTAMTGLNDRTTRHWVQEMVRCKLVYICGWRRAGTSFRPFFKLGQGVTPPRPSKLNTPLTIPTMERQGWLPGLTMERSKDKRSKRKYLKLVEKENA